MARVIIEPNPARELRKPAEKPPIMEIRISEMCINQVLKSVYEVRENITI